MQCWNSKKMKFEEAMKSNIALNCEDCQNLIKNYDLNDLFFCDICEHFGTEPNECGCVIKD